MEYCKLSEIGDREVNEDAVGVFSIGDKEVFVLADGLGGHGYGEIASKEAVEAVKKYVACNESEDLETLIRCCFTMANIKLKKIQQEVGNETFFKTTMVVLIVDKYNMAWGHIGDSRIYHFERRKLIERSMDHSVPQMLANAKKIKEKQIRYHEDRSKLLRVLGAEEENSMPYISKPEPISKDSSYLLCSDGFWEHITERKIEKILRKTTDTNRWIEDMKSIVIKNGAKHKMDNYSAIAVFL